MSQAAAGRRVSQWTLCLFLVAASFGLGEEALAEEAYKAASGDVDCRLVGGHVGEFVQFPGPECLVRVLVEGVHDGVVGGARLGPSGRPSVGRRPAPRTGRWGRCGDLERDRARRRSAVATRGLSTAESVQWM